MLKPEDIVYIKPLKKTAVLVSFAEDIYTKENIAYCADDDGNHMLVKINDLEYVCSIWDKYKEQNEYNIKA